MGKHYKHHPDPEIRRQRRLAINHPDRCPECGMLGSQLIIIRTHFEIQEIPCKVKKALACVKCDLIFSAAPNNSEKEIIKVKIEGVIR